MNIHTYFIKQFDWIIQIMLLRQCDDERLTLDHDGSLARGLSMEVTSHCSVLSGIIS